MSNRFKYPRTFHLPFSLGSTSDDKVLKNTDHFNGKEIVVTIKMDGENLSNYSDGFHARSLDSQNHPSRFWVARWHAAIAHDIPEGWRICGENLYARHSIAYDNLPSYFMGFSIWNEENYALSWDETIDYFQLLNITPVMMIYRGSFNLTRLKIIANQLDTNIHEGFVIRLADKFHYKDFSRSVAKWVRAKHVQTNQHWMHSTIVPNKLKGQI